MHHSCCLAICFFFFPSTLSLPLFPLSSQNEDLVHSSVPIGSMGFSSIFRKALLLGWSSVPGEREESDAMPQGTAVSGSIVRLGNLYMALLETMAYCHWDIKRGDRWKEKNSIKCLSKLWISSSVNVHALGAGPLLSPSGTPSFGALAMEVESIT